MSHQLGAMTTMGTTDLPTHPPRGSQGSDFTDLIRLVRRAGLLRRRHGYYAAQIAVNLLLLAATAAAFLLIGDSWWQLVVAVILAMVSTQFAFVGHDAGHQQIFRSRRANDLVGRIHGAITGISYQWWVGKHNRHHANPNHEGSDPDIDIPALAFSPEQARNKRGLLRWVAKYQAFLFFPMLLAEAVMLRISSFQAALRREVRSSASETVLLVLNTVGYLAIVFGVLSPLKAVLFILVHQGVMGVYLGCAFAPNHKGMPIVPPDQRLDFLRRQVLTSRNITGGRWVDVLLGGLNYQIEHHLFPNMPRPNLRRVQPIVQRFCQERGIPYTQCSLPRSYLWVLRHLHEVGAPLRQAVS